MTTKTDNRSKLEVIKETLGIEWSSEQEAIILCSAREVLGGGGERAGKSWVAAHYFNVRSMNVRDGLYWIAGKDYDRCHEEFEYIAQAMLTLKAVLPKDIHTPQSGQWHMELLTGTVIKTWSLQDWLKVGSEAPDGIIIAEVAQISHTEYLRLADRTAEKRGWLVGTGTFEGSLGWFPELWKLYQLPGQAGKSFSIPTWSNTFIFPGGYNDPEIQRLRDKYVDRPDYFMERFGGVPSPPKGLVFPEFRALIHVKTMDIQDRPVYLWIDPGYAGAYAVEVVQFEGETIKIIDEIYEQGLVSEEITKVVMQKPWFKLVAGGVVDVAARQHQAMPAVEKIWETSRKDDGWPGIPLSSKFIKEEEGRERLHTFLTVNPIDHQPRLFIDPRCKGILSEFGVCANPFTDEAAPYKWKEARTGEVVGKHPDDKNNHGIKAVIYGLVDKFGFVSRGLGSKYTTSLSVRRR